MKLPQMDYPIHEVQLLSIKEPVKFRPFTVREEKIMMMAVEAGELETSINAIKQIISNCLVSEVDVENMAMVDVETMFLHLRARSIGEVGAQFYKCQNKIDDKPCGMLIEVPINFLQIPIVNKDTPKKIQLSDSLGVMMKFPTISLARKLSGVLVDDLEVTIAANCLDMIYDKDEVFMASDCTQEELIEFILKLPADKYEMIKNFCVNVPKTQLITNQKCVKCDFEHTFKLEGIQDFFE